MNQFLKEKFLLINDNIDCQYHTDDEMFHFFDSLKRIPKDIKGCIVECGSYKGGSTAKISLMAKLLNRKLVVFDSFEGLPKHNELPAQEDVFYEGAYSATLDEVKKNILNFGEIDICDFRKGWFKDTMKNFRESVVGIFLDVDLAYSTETCLRYLYPLMKIGGVLYSQDMWFNRVKKLFEDENFWREIGYIKPKFEYLPNVSNDKYLSDVSPKLMRLYRQ